MRSGCHQGWVRISNLIWFGDCQLPDGEQKKSKACYDSYKGTDPIHEGSMLMTSSNLISQIPHLLIPSHWGGLAESFNIRIGEGAMWSTYWASLVAQMVKNLPVMQETQV